MAAPDNKSAPPIDTSSLPRFRDSFDTLDMIKALSPNIPSAVITLDVQAANAFSSLPHTEELAIESSKLDEGIGKISQIKGKETLHTEFTKQHTDIDTKINELGTNDLEALKQHYLKLKDVHRELRDLLAKKNEPQKVKVMTEELKKETKVFNKETDDYRKEYDEIRHLQNELRAQMGKQITLEPPTHTTVAPPRMGGNS